MKFHNINPKHEYAIDSVVVEQPDAKHPFRIIHLLLCYPGGAPAIEGARITLTEGDIDRITRKLRA
jgi:hypothetical protein